MVGLKAPKKPVHINPYCEDCGEALVCPDPWWSDEWVCPECDKDEIYLDWPLEKLGDLEYQWESDGRAGLSACLSPAYEMERPPTIYISGPYTADDLETRNANIDQANEEAQRWAKRGWAPFCPHTMSRDWEKDTDMGHDDFLRIDKEWIRRSDAIAMLPGWENSKGANGELELAQAIGLPVYCCEAGVWRSGLHE